jgi:hypothetical protein
MSGQVAQRPRGHLFPIGTMAAVAFAFTAVGLPMGIGTLDQYGPSGLVFILIFPAIVLSLTLVGAFVAYRVPANPIGWLLEVAGMAAAIGIFGGTYVNFDHVRSAGLPLTTLIAWLASWGLLPAIGLLAIYVPLLFPTGRFLSSRWRTFGLLGLVGAAASFIAPAFVPGPLEAAPWIDNPVGIVGAAGLLDTLSAVSNVMTPIFFAGAVISVFVRYRRAGTTERQQLKWFGLVALGEVVAFVLSIPNNGVVSDIAWMVGLALMPLIPVSIGLAILRYRLYDIDRIISRTIGWGLVTGAIVLTFAGAVFGLDTMLAGFTQGQTLAVAASTLVAFALFQPVRRRTQAAVDRRFDRTRYDGQRAVDAFAEELRDRVDLLAIQRGALATVDQTVRPTHVALWLRRNPEV